jgi:hypothetical protein
VIEKLHDRARRMRERELIRAWEYRQRSHSNGVWYRIRRVLVDAAEAWIIDEHTADRLENQGHIPLPVGREFSPPKRVFSLSVEESNAVPHRRRIPVRLCAELLQARSLVLFPHEFAADSIDCQREP